MGNKKVMVAMSGGVDSAVAALLVRDHGFQTSGITMCLWSEHSSVPDETPAPCPDENAREALAIADRLGIPHTTVALGQTFYRSVVTPFIDSYAIGKTPNPCVLCNRHIKFGVLPAIAHDMGYPTLATGHYARVEQDASGRFLLKKATDTSKDQSYFLWSLTQKTLSSVLFPLGGYTKPEIREIAAAHGFTNAHKSDSQDICFIPNGDYVSFIHNHSDKEFPKGHFLDVEGRTLGEHEGLLRYTIGQRKGLGIALGQPMFVKAKDPIQNTVTLCTDAELFSNTLTASEVNWIACDTPTTPIRAEVKIRYRHTAAPATVEVIDNGRVAVTFDSPQRAIAPGQSIVFYDGDTVIGGGVIY